MLTRFIISRSPTHLQSPSTTCCAMCLKCGILDETPLFCLCRKTLDVKKAKTEAQAKNLINMSTCACYAAPIVKKWKSASHQLLFCTKRSGKHFPSTLLSFIIISRFFFFPTLATENKYLNN